MISQLLKLRKELHRHPELSGKEKETAKRIKTFIEAFKPTEIIENIGGYGLAVIYEFSKTGITIAIRCELDALPIQESNDFEHQSTQEGVSHKCGHDGHMAIVAGLASWLQQVDFEEGRVILIFQPAEENGAGAKAIINHPKFQTLNIDYIFALHNLPKLPMHQIIVYQNQFSPTVQSLAIKLTGKTAHAAEPENGKNPATAISKILQFAKSLEQSKASLQDFALITPVFITMGEPTYGISAGYGEVHFTMRAWQKERMEYIIEQLQSTLNNIATSEGLTVKYDWFDYFPTVVNDDFCNEMIKQAAFENEFEVKEPTHGLRFGEDFGWFSQQFKSAMFGLGAGLDTPALHNDDYDFPDELIKTGIEMFKGIITEILE
jgi:amidohydrolase